MSSPQASRAAAVLVVSAVVTVVMLTPVLGFGPLVAVAAAFLAAPKIRQMLKSN